jgi:hypothetical protein
MVKIILICVAVLGVLFAETSPVSAQTAAERAIACLARKARIWSGVQYRDWGAIASRSRCLGSCTAKLL